MRNTFYLLCCVLTALFLTGSAKAQETYGKAAIQDGLQRSAFQALNKAPPTANSVSET